MLISIDEVIIINKFTNKVFFATLTWDSIMNIVALMNNSPYWESYDISDLSIALVSADMAETWNLIMIFMKSHVGLTSD